MPLAYELNTRCWLRDLSSREKRSVMLDNVPEFEFQEWLRLGFTHIWLMGVWSSGPRSRAVAIAVDDLQKVYGGTFQTIQHADIAASPYAIAEYRVSQQLGGDDALKRFRAKLHQHGMKLLLDFVPNHLGLDHYWLKERPDLFIQSVSVASGYFEQETVHGRRFIAHGRDPYFPPWADTAQLDYRNPVTREAMITQLLQLAERCDGVRCDMAMLVLNDIFEKTWKDIPFAGAARSTTEFWSDAIQSVRAKHKAFLFIAEAYWGLEERLQSLGFDFTYNKELYDELIRHDAAAVQRRLLSAKPEFLEHSFNFLENHDERRVASVLSEEEHRAAAAVVLSLPGFRLLHEGQLTGARFRSAVQVFCRPTEPIHPAIGDFYERLLTTLKSLPFETGAWRVLAPDRSEPAHLIGNAILISWRAESEFWLTAVNLGSQPIRIHVIVPDETPAVAMEELLGYSVGGSTIVGGHIQISLHGYGLQILKLASVPTSNRR